MNVPGFTAEASLYQSSRPYWANGHSAPAGVAGVVPAVNWGSLSAKCTGPGVGKYSAILWNIPWGQSWEQTCASTPAPAGTPVAGKLPTRCVKSWFNLNIWGEWDVPMACCHLVTFWTGRQCTWDYDCDAGEFCQYGDCMAFYWGC